MSEMISAAPTRRRRSKERSASLPQEPPTWERETLLRRWCRGVLERSRAGVPLLPSLLISGGLAAVLMRYRRQLGDLLREQRLLRRDAEIAREIQLATLTPPPPHPRLETAIHFEPAQEIGGDFYSFFSAGSRLGVILGDVSGKGISAALVATSICHLARWLRPMQDPSGFLARLNRELLEQLPPATYATMVSAMLDPDAEHLVIYNAGHPPGLLLSREGVRRVRQPNLPLGLFPDVAFVPECLPFQSGETLVLYSDALIEARNEAGEELGIEGLETLLRRYAGLSPAELVKQLVAEVCTFGTVNDDLTLVVVRLRPGGGADVGSPRVRGR